MKAIITPSLQESKITVEDVKKAASQINANAEAKQAEQSRLLNELQTAINNLDSDDDTLKILGGLLNLPEDDFAQLAPVFLQELSQSYMSSNDRIAMVQMLNAQGIKIEDIKDEYERINKDIDEELGASISAQKRSFLKEIISMSYNAIMETEGVAKKTMRVPIEICDERARIPEYAHMTDAGMDVYALEDTTIAPGETKLVPLGIKIAIPVGYAVLVQPRSGLSVKTKLRIANTPGLIDSGYRGEIKVIVENIDNPIRALHPKEDGSLDAGSIEYGQAYTIGAGERIAQLRLVEVPHIAFYKVDQLEESDRGEGGFGSSGKF